MLQLGAAIRITRQAKGMALGELAKASEVSSPFLSLVEKGRRNVSLDVLRRIAVAMDVPVEALIILSHPATGSLRSSDRRTNRLARSITELANAETRLRSRLAEREQK
jgi:transcriptional regulator with XRE-family HTH domain